MTYEGLIGDIFPAEYGDLCPTCRVNVAVGLVCLSCQSQFQALGKRLGNRLVRRVQRQRQRTGGKAGKLWKTATR